MGGMPNPEASPGPPRKNIKDNQIPDALVSTGSAEGGTQMLLKQTARIVCHYHNPTDADIDNWIARGKIDHNYKPLFLAHSQKTKDGYAQRIVNPSGA